MSNVYEILPDLEKYPEFILPKRGSARASGLDVFAQEDLYITSKTQLVDLGFKAAYPNTMTCLLLPRSGFGSKFGLSLSNTIGLLDEDYRGTVMAAAVLNGTGTKQEELDAAHAQLKEAMDKGEMLSQAQYENYLKGPGLLIKKGEAIGQLLFLYVAHIEPMIVTELSETVRGEGGFGSTTESLA